MRTQTMTQQESLTLIAEMIEQTKRRYRLEDGNSYLFWGYLSVATCGLVWLLLVLTHNPLFHWLWFLIPLVGMSRSYWIKDGKAEEGYVLTYTDRIVHRTGTIIGYSAWVISAMCLVFSFYVGPYVWTVMLVYGFLVVGLGMLFMGLVLEERSMQVGGALGALSGVLICCVLVARLPLMTEWVFPLYMVDFALMMIVPGYIIRSKARRSISV